MARFRIRSSSASPSRFLRAALADEAGRRSSAPRGTTVLDVSRRRLMLAIVVLAATFAGLTEADAAKPSGDRPAARSAAHKKSHRRARRRAWYVSATARPGGNGSRRAPFRSLSKVQRASHSGDRIVIVP